VTNTLVAFEATGDDRIDFVMPAGEDGTTADITVETLAGSETAQQAFRYVAPLAAEFSGQTGAVITTPNGVVMTIPPQGVDGMFVITLTPVAPVTTTPGTVLMHSFRLDALLNWVPLSTLTNPITVALPVDPAIVPNAERPWLYQWITIGTVTGAQRSAAGGRWMLVPRQIYDSANRTVSVALKPMGLYALSTSYRRATHFPMVPVLR
jgi:hypothetical protein